MWLQPAAEIRIHRPSSATPGACAPTAVWGPAQRAAFSKPLLCTGIPPPPLLSEQRIGLSVGTFAGLSTVLWSSNAYVQATPGVGSVNYCTVDFGGALFHSFHRVPCVPPDPLVLRCTLFMFCVKAALLAKRAFVVCFASWFSEQYTMSTRVSRKLQCVSHTLVQTTLRRWCRQCLVIYRCLDKGGGGGYTNWYPALRVFLRAGQDRQTEKRCCE